MEVTEDILKEFIGHVGWLGAQHIFNGEEDWVDFITASKAFMLSVGMVNGQIPYDMDVIKKSIVNELCKRNLLEFKKTDTTILLRIKRKEEEVKDGE